MTKQLSMSWIVAVTLGLLGQGCASAPAPATTPTVATPEADGEPEATIAAPQPESPGDEAAPIVEEATEASSSRVCSPDGWCWTNPTPYVMALNAVWVASDENVWAAGQDGVIWRWNGTGIDAVESGTDQTLRALWGSDSGGLLAVGDGGTILHWDGSRWSPQRSGTTNELIGISETGDGDIWVVGGGGTILHWDGGAWSASASGTDADLYGVWASAPDDVWAVGYGGLSIHWNGTAWSEVRSATRRGLRVMWGFAPDDVWAGGNAGTIVHWNGRIWSDFSISTLSTATGIWGPRPDDVWIMFDGQIVHWNGDRLTSSIRSYGTALLNVHGSASGQPWIAGSNGVLLRRDEGIWRSVTSVSDSRIISIGGGGPDDVWAFSREGVTLRWDGSRWTVAQRPMPGNDRFSEDWFTGADQNCGMSFAFFFEQGAAWALDYCEFYSEEAHIWQWDGDRWRDRIAELTVISGNSDMPAAWSSGPDLLHILFYPSPWVRWNGRTWAGVAPGLLRDETYYSAVGGSGPADVWVLGSETAIHFDGRRSSRLPFPPDGVASTLESSLPVPSAIWGIAPDDIWVVGSYRGAALHWDGQAWSAVATGQDDISLADIWASGPNDVWAVGRGGAILHWDGTSWTRLDSGTTSDLSCVWGTGPNDVWVGGAGGAILHYQGT